MIHTALHFLGMNKIYTALGALVLVVLIGFFGWSANQHKTESIKIGAILGLTGPAATDSLNMKRGLDLAQADLAAKGVVVDINYQDDKTDPKQSVSAAQYLLTSYGPNAIVGPAWEFLEDAADPVIAAAKTVSYAPADTSEYTNFKSPYTFRGAPRVALSEQPLAEWLQKNNKKRIAIVVLKGGWGDTNAKAMRAAAKDAGATVVLDESFQSGTPDAANLMATALLKAKNVNADILFWSGFDPDAVALAKKRNELKFLVPVVVASTVYDSLLSRNAVSKEELKDMYFVSIPVSPDFVAKFKTKYGEAPGPYADRAYDGLMLLAQAIQNSPSRDGDAIAAQLRKINYQGYGGVYQFNNDGDVESGSWVIESIVR